ncbi:8-amino-7-oxononanoate synthase [Cellulophaga tyrosinoxydans]|uniref:8-amino-7-oxononanoate synthase n=2 Tax=Cellulophaga tyrosinoxydans TaxID=504486 RepID=A0A1W1Z4S2_9FLAO|nr:8-amino-7-oxononanoate synthase [Cellulophaga tyrosinoxydans]
MFIATNILYKTRIYYICSMANFPKKLSKKLTERAAQNALRELPLSSNLIDFTSNDYLGFSKNLSIYEKASKLLSDENHKRNGATGSRLISGNYSLYTQVEQNIASFHQVDSALVFNSGYDANVGFFGAVPQRGDVILYDEYIHASIRDGIAMSNAKAFKFKHNSLEDLGKVIRRIQANLPSESEIYVVTESVFSMDGDSPDLQSFAKLCADNGYHLVVDEAHAIGVFGFDGQGLLFDLGIQNQVFAQIITYGKAMGCHGAAILGSDALKEFLINFSRSFIYTTGLPPHSVATIMAAYQELTQEKSSREKLQQLISYIHGEVKNQGLETVFIPSNSAIHCCLIPNADKVKKVAKNLEKKGYNVKAILSPTVPLGQERLRICLHSYNTIEEIKNLLSILKTAMTSL